MLSTFLHARCPRSARLKVSTTERTLPALPHGLDNSDFANRRPAIPKPCAALKPVAQAPVALNDFGQVVNSASMKKVRPDNLV